MGPPLGYISVVFGLPEIPTVKRGPNWMKFLQGDYIYISIISTGVDRS